MRRGGPAVRRRQGGRGRRPQGALRRGEGAAHSPVHGGAACRHRAEHRHPRAGHGHQRPDHGLDHGRLLDAGGRDASRRRHREAAGRRRQLRPRRGARRSVAIVARKALAHYDRPVDDTTVTVQGFGSVGANAARLLDEWGADIVAVSDVHGAIHDPAGLDVGTIPPHDEGPGAVTEQDGDVIDNAALLELDVDLLAPCAVGNVITVENVDDVRADVVVEGANGPTTFEADTALAERDVPVVPDVLANAGGVTVSSFEWLQDINRRAWSRERVNVELHSEMAKAWDAVEAAYERNEDATWRDAAYVVAIERLSRAHEARGLWP